MCMCHYYHYNYGYYYYYYYGLFLSAVCKQRECRVPRIYSFRVYLNPASPHTCGPRGDEWWPSTPSTLLTHQHPLSPPSHPEMACTVLSLSPFGPVKREKWGFYGVISRHSFGPDEIFFSMFVQPAQSGVSLWVSPSRLFNPATHKATWDEESGVK